MMFCGVSYLNFSRNPQAGSSWIDSKSQRVFSFGTVEHGSEETLLIGHYNGFVCGSFCYYFQWCLSSFAEAVEKPMWYFLIASSYMSFSVGDSSGYYSSLIFQRLDKDREEREQKKAKRKGRPIPEIKLRDEMVEQITDAAYIPGALWHFYFYFLVFIFSNFIIHLIWLCRLALSALQK